MSREDSVRRALGKVVLYAILVVIVLALYSGFSLKALK